MNTFRFIVIFYIIAFYLCFAFVSIFSSFGKETHKISYMFALMDSLIFASISSIVFWIGFLCVNANGEFSTNAYRFILFILSIVSGPISACIPYYIHCNKSFL